MADEAVCIETPIKFARYTVADASAIPIGTLMNLSGDYTVTASSGNGDVFGGIAWEEKSLSDGLTQITVALDGVWDIKVNATNTVTLGADVVISGSNLIRNAVEADMILGRIVGKAEEAGSTSEVIRVRVGVI